ncbi:MAG: hypothetical protein KBC95_01375 [Candidatus Peribacteraceae bacterium]|nr:hypothetical protein [Candidatus Peribacteraceae bacterium]
MIFRRIEQSLALQLTAVVFGLLLINGAVFMAADVQNERREQSLELLRESQQVQRALPEDLIESIEVLPPRLRERVRIIDQEGDIFYEGSLFNGLPFSYSSEDGIATVSVQGDMFEMLTAPVVRDEEFLGYMQIMRPQVEATQDLPFRISMYILVSIGISGLTYLVGRFFARQSLKPAEDSMQRLEQFTQDASHELRTPLTVLGSSLDVAMRTKQYEAGIASAKQDLKEIVRLVERMLELARVDRFALRVGSFDFAALVAEQTEKLQSAMAEAGLTLETKIEAGVTVDGDPTLLKHVIVNLLSNAVKFSPRGGTVTVSLNTRRLAVADTGVGIPAESLPFIFERFYQSDGSRSRGGYGLGLALAKRIVDLHGWRIEAESEPGRGSTFTVRFAGRLA